MPERKRVVLIVESSRAYGRGCLAGIAAYLRVHHGPWRTLHLERSIEQRIPAIVGQWNGDGLIARIDNVAMVEEVANLRLPTVDLRGTYCPVGGATFDTNAGACARLAAAHFLERGFRHFAFCGFSGIEFSDQRCDEFVSRITECGHEVIVYEPPRRRKQELRAAEASGESNESHTAKWLQSLPFPAAVFACNDVRGRQVLSACEAAGLAVPDEVAVLGVDDDEVICELSSPPLSSIRPDTHEIGFQGAEMLDAMMSGIPVGERRISLPPRGIMVRRSTDVLAHDDSVLVAAIRYIRDHACDNIGVSDVVREVSLSRATLERRFNQALGHSPAAEIEKIRMRRAKMLLAETDYKLAKIALMTGYQTASHLATVFKRHVGSTPGEYRQSQRTGV